MKENKELGYIYGLICPLTNEIRYIGQTTKSLNERKRGHLNKFYRSLSINENNKKTHKEGWFYQLHKLDRLKELEIVLIEQCDKSIIYDREQIIINEYKTNGYKLTNLKDGGYNPSGHKLGNMTDENKKKISEGGKKSWVTRKNTPEDIERVKKIKKTKLKRYGTLTPPKLSDKKRIETNNKISESIKGENNPFYNKSHTEKSKRLMSDNRPDYSGDNNPFYNKSHTDESKLLIKESRKNQVMKCKFIGLYDSLNKQIIKKFYGISEVIDYLKLPHQKRYYYSLINTNKVFNNMYLAYLE